MESEDSELSSSIALSYLLVNFTDFSRFLSPTMVLVFLRTLGDPTKFFYGPQEAEASPLEGVSFIGLNCREGVGAALGLYVGFALRAGGSISLSITSLNTRIISLSSSPLLIPPYFVKEMFDLAYLLRFRFRDRGLANNDVAD